MVIIEKHDVGYSPAARPTILRRRYRGRDHRRDRRREHRCDRATTGLPPGQGGRGATTTAAITATATMGANGGRAGLLTGHCGFRRPRGRTSDKRAGGQKARTHGRRHERTQRRRQDGSPGDLARLVPWLQARIRLTTWHDSTGGDKRGSATKHSQICRGHEACGNFSTPVPNQTLAPAKPAALQPTARKG